MSARAHSGDVRADPSLPNRVGVVRGYEASSNQSFRLRWVPCRREGRRGARELERREHRARDGGVHDDGDHAATAAARARKHVGGEQPRNSSAQGTPVPRVPERLGVARGHQPAELLLTDPDTLAQWTRWLRSGEMLDVDPLGDMIHLQARDGGPVQRAQSWLEIQRRFLA
jgi:hypothetical protein